MECYRVHIPDGVKISGVTANAYLTTVGPGEYLVHRLRGKVAANDKSLLRFVGADAAGRDVHVPTTSVRRLASMCELPQELLEEDRELAMSA